MKTLVLLAVAALGLAGCDLLNGGCPSFDSVPTREQRTEALAVVSLPDTVVVAFVETPLFPYTNGVPVSLGAPLSAGSDSVRVRAFLTTRREAPDLSARLDVRGDTVFVSLDAPLVRLFAATISRRGRI